MERLLQLKNTADSAYFNTGIPIMSDEAYDGLCQHITLIENLSDGDVSTSHSIGCLPSSHLDKVKLPIHMGSLTKHNDNKKIKNFLNKFNHKSFIVQEKLDGVSCLYVYGSSEISQTSTTRCEVSLYTRGNGLIGTNISHLLKYGLKLPILFFNSYPFMVRGELIMSKKIFQNKYASKFKNIRNMISGQLSTKDPDAAVISDLDFVAYEVIESQKFQKCLNEQYQFLKNHSFKVVYNRKIERDLIEQTILVDYLQRRQNKSKYQIDGLVVTINGKYERNKSDNPKYSFAFKIQGATAEVEVDDIKWNLSKSGKYKPQIFIRPVELGGVTISSLTGFNAKYVVTNNIGRGTKLLITRSGDVIPHIITILSNLKEDIPLPENSRWESVDLYHNFNETPNEVVIKQMVHFFTSLQCLNCKYKTILKIYNSGYKTIESIIEARVEDLARIEGIGSVLARKLISSIQVNVKNANVFDLLAALNSFGEGIGLKKIQNLDLNNPEKQVKGLSQTTINEKILPVWNSSLERVKNIKKIVGENLKIEKEVLPRPLGTLDPWTERIFVFTGFRDSSLEKQIINLGGKVTTSVSTKTTDVITATTDEDVSMCPLSNCSAKLTKAKNLGIKITTKKNLIKQINQIK
jgi:DNA ligase (NAD+)